MFTHKYEIFISKSTHEVHIAEGMSKELLQKTKQLPVNKESLLFLSMKQH